MNTPTTQPDGGHEEVVVRGIDDDTPQGINPDDTPQGTDVDTSAESGDDGVAPITDRNETISSLDDRIEQQRKDEQIGYLTETGQITEEQAAAQLAEESVAEAGVTVEPMHPDTPAEDAKLPESVSGDPLADFMVQDEETGEVFFRTKVNGEERLLTPEKVRAHLQKHESADVRLQDSSLQLKDLREREERLRLGEVALQADAQALRAGTRLPSAPTGPDADDQGNLDEEAREVVAGLFSGSEAEAAEKLAAILRKSRASGPQVDPQAIAATAAKAAREQVVTENRLTAEREGFAYFKKEFPDLVADRALFAMADAMTDAIQKDNPTWTPAQIMEEAGNRTRKRVTPTSEASPEPTDRQTRKRKLRPMPTLRSSEVVTSQPEDAPETPADVVADMRSARGQPN